MFIHVRPSTGFVGCDQVKLKVWTLFWLEFGKEIITERVYRPTSSTQHSLQKCRYLAGKRTCNKEVGRDQEDRSIVCHSCLRVQAR
jgi:hypothetical protein